MGGWSVVLRSGGLDRRDTPATAMCSLLLLAQGQNHVPRYIYTFQQCISTYIIYIFSAAPFHLYLCGLDNTNTGRDASYAATLGATCISISISIYIHIYYITEKIYRVHSNVKELLKWLGSRFACMCHSNPRVTPWLRCSLLVDQYSVVGKANKRHIREPKINIDNHGRCHTAMVPPEYFLI